MMNRRTSLRALVFALLALAAPVDAASEPVSPDALVRSLYKAHEARTGPFENPKNRTVSERYFTKQLAELLRKDAIAANGEVGALDFDPLYDSQDPEITNFVVGQPQVGGGGASWKNIEPKDAGATVIVTFKDQGEPKKLVFTLKKNEAGAWRISDIAYPAGHTMAGLLKAAQ